jgi:hypothetical protein
MSLVSLLLVAAAVQEPVAFWFPSGATNSLLGFSASADGDAAPLRVITGDRTGLGLPSSVVVGPDGRLYVANSTGKSVTVYSADATGNAPPLRVIQGPETGLDRPGGIAVGLDGTIYVANSSDSRGRVTVYAPDAQGDVAPIRSIWGSRTTLNWISGIAVDRKDRLYVGSYYGARIRVFAPGANGNVSPLRTIGDRPARWGREMEASAITTGPDDRVYAMTVTNERTVNVFPPGAREHTLAERVIAGPNTSLGFPSAIAVDRQGRIGILTHDYGGPGRIVVYDTTARDDARPVQTIAGPATGLDRPKPLQPPKPPLPRRILHPSVVIFAPGATGDVPPVRRIAGESTLLATPVSLGLSSDTTLYVLSCQGRVTGYSPKANGNVIPDRLPTGLGLAEAMAYGLVIAGRDTLYVSRNWMAGWGNGGYVDVYVRGSPNRQRRLKGFGVGRTGIVRDTAGLLYRGSNAGFDVIDPSGWSDSAKIGQMIDRRNESRGGEAELYWPGNFSADSHGRLVVPNADDAVRVYAADTTRDLRPLRTLSGWHTGLDRPIATALGPGDTLFVANSGPAHGPSVTVYRPNAAGDEAPVRRIAGPRTGMEALRALAVDGSGSIYVVNNPEGDDGCFPKEIM